MSVSGSMHGSSRWDGASSSSSSDESDEGAVVQSEGGAASGGPPRRSSLHLPAGSGTRARPVTATATAAVRAHSISGFDDDEFDLDVGTPTGGVRGAPPREGAEFSALSNASFSTSLHLDHRSYEAELEAAAQEREEAAAGADTATAAGAATEDDANDSGLFDDLETPMELEVSRVGRPSSKQSARAATPASATAATISRRHTRPPSPAVSTIADTIAAAAAAAAAAASAVEPQPSEADAPPPPISPSSLGALDVFDPATSPLRKLAFCSQRLRAAEVHHLLSEVLHPVHIPSSLRSRPVHTVGVDLDLASNAIEGGVAAFLEPLRAAQVPLVSFAASHNHLEDLSGLAAFSTTLVTVVASHNAIPRLERVFQACAALTHLDLSFNQLTTIDASGIAAATSLARLGLASNRLRRIEELRGHPSLEQVDLRNNLLADASSVLAVLSRMPRLSRLALDGNPAFARKGGGAVSGRASILAELRDLKYLDDEPVDAASVARATSAATAAASRRAPSPAAGTRRAPSPAPAAARRSPSPAPAATAATPNDPVEQQYRSSGRGRRAPSPGPSSSASRGSSLTRGAAAAASPRSGPMPTPAASTTTTKPATPRSRGTAASSARATSIERAAASRGASPARAPATPAPAPAAATPASPSSASTSTLLAAARPQGDRVQASLTRELISLNQQLIATTEELTRSEAKRLEIARMQRDQDRLQEEATSGMAAAATSATAAISPSSSSTIAPGGAVPHASSSGHALADMKSLLLDRAHRRKMSGSAAAAVLPAHDYLNPGEEASLETVARVASAAAARTHKQIQQAHQRGQQQAAVPAAAQSTNQFASLVDAIDVIVAKAASRPPSRNASATYASSAAANATNTPSPHHPTSSEQLRRRSISHASSSSEDEYGERPRSKSRLQLLSESDDFTVRPHANDSHALTAAAVEAHAEAHAAAGAHGHHRRSTSRSLDEARSVSLTDVIGAGAFATPPSANASHAQMQHSRRTGGASSVSSTPRAAAEVPTVSQLMSRHEQSFGQHDRTTPATGALERSFDELDLSADNAADEPDDLSVSTTLSPAGSTFRTGRSSAVFTAAPGVSASVPLSGSGSSNGTGLSLTDLRVENLLLRKKGGALLAKYQSARVAASQQEAMLLEQRRAMDVRAGLDILGRLLAVRARGSISRAFLEWVACVTRIRAHGIAALRCALERAAHRAATADRSALHGAWSHWRTTRHVGRFADLRTRWMREWERDLAKAANDKACTIIATVCAASHHRARRVALARTLTAWQARAALLRTRTETTAQLHTGAEERQLLIAMVLQHKQTLDANERAAHEASVASQVSAASLLARAEKAEKDLAAQDGLVRAVTSQREVEERTAAQRFERAAARARGASLLAQRFERLSRTRLQNALRTWILFVHDLVPQANEPRASLARTVGTLMARVREAERRLAEAEATIAKTSAAKPPSENGTTPPTPETEAPATTTHPASPKESQETTTANSQVALDAPTPSQHIEAAAHVVAPKSNGLNTSRTTDTAAPQPQHARTDSADAFLQYHLQSYPLPPVERQQQQQFEPFQQQHQPPPPPQQQQYLQQAPSQQQFHYSQPPAPHQSLHGLAGAPPNASPAMATAVAQQALSPRRHDIHHLTGGASPVSPRFTQSGYTPALHAQAAPPHAQAYPFYDAGPNSSPAGHYAPQSTMPSPPPSTSLDAELRAAQEARRVLEQETAEIARKIAEARARSNVVYARQRNGYTNAPTQTPTLTHHQQPHQMTMSQPQPQLLQQHYQPVAGNLPPFHGQPHPAARATPTSVGHSPLFAHQPQQQQRQTYRY